ncbi:MAG: transcriptional repressor LexA [Desulfuromonadales bacterium]|nr:transcriptional repressor LexA [Desulfuromonadales bacterium]
MSPPTERQQQVYDFLTAYLAANGYPPTLQEIAGHLGVSGNLGVLRHLKALEREGLITRNPGSSRAIALVGGVESGSVVLPLVGSVRAGLPQLAIEEIEAYIAVDCSLVKAKGSFLLRVKGDSMIEAHIVEGDLVVVRPQSTAENGEIVVAMIDGEATLKRFFHEGDRIRLQPENDDLQPIFVAADTQEVTVVGKVTGLYRVLE